MPFFNSAGVIIELIQLEGLRRVSIDHTDILLCWVTQAEVCRRSGISCETVVRDVAVVRVVARVALEVLEV